MQIEVECTNIEDKEDLSMRSVSHRLPIADLWNSTLLPAENSERLDLESGILMGKSELRRIKKDDPLNTCNGAKATPRIHIQHQNLLLIALVLGKSFTMNQIRLKDPC